MFKGHPKGLYVAFFTNMGERFGFYTMIAIFSLFLQAKYGINSTQLGLIYGLFMAFLYFFPMVGGLLADRVLGYGKTISIGIIVMFIGYFLLAIPSGHGTGFGFIIGALAVIVVGTGLFKGNLQALVGNLYDDPKYSSVRDRAFNIFYMGINIGAMFAPTAAEMISNNILKAFHFTYDARIPALANDFLKTNVPDASYLSIAQAQLPSVTATTLHQFSTDYLDALGRSYHWAFSAACVSLLISMMVFWIFRKHYKQADMTEKQKAKSEEHKSQVIELTPKQIKERLIALFLVFFVVIFFWMSFQQNGLCMTLFARDYTQPMVDRFTNIWFDLPTLLCFAAVTIGIFLAFTSKELLIKGIAAMLLTGGIIFSLIGRTLSQPIFVIIAIVGSFLLVQKIDNVKKIIGTLLIIFGCILISIFISNFNEINPFTPQKFQHFNPFFIVALTPIVIGLFAWLNKKGKEPSSPRKIGIGMLITAVAFTVLIFASMGLPSPKQLGGVVAPANLLVSPYFLIVTYFILTVAELFLSPMGISFVSRVAPPKYKGTMQGFWFAATGIGNFLLFVGAWLWGFLPLWGLWLVLAVACLLSAAFIFSVMKRLERTSQNA